MAEKHKKRADGRYQTTATIDGKRKFFFGKTFKEATENKETYLKTVQAAPHVDYNITLGQWLAIWLKGAKNTLSESSFVSIYMRILLVYPCYPAVTKTNNKSVICKDLRFFQYVTRCL